MPYQLVVGEKNSPTTWKTQTQSLSNRLGPLRGPSTEARQAVSLNGTTVRGLAMAGPRFHQRATLLQSLFPGLVRRSGRIHSRPVWSRPSATTSESPSPGQRMGRCVPPPPSSDRRESNAFNAAAGRSWQLSFAQAISVSHIRGRPVSCPAQVDRTEAQTAKKA
jgi:hypothetical protein